MDEGEGCDKSLFVPAFEEVIISKACQALGVPICGVPSVICGGCVFRRGW